MACIRQSCTVVAPNNQCQTTGPSGGVLVGYGGQVDAGTGLFGIAATGNAGGGLFYGNGNGFSAGAQISGGAAGYAGGSVAGAPSQSGQPFSFGAYAGASPTVTFTNARSVQQLSGPFTTWTLNLGSGPVTGSLQLSYSNGIWEFSIGLPVPRVSPGIGASVSKLTTQTATTKTGCGSGG
jgi:hypothetical protein